MSHLVELIKSRIVQIEQRRKANDPYAAALSNAPSYERDSVLISLLANSMGQDQREWVILKSLLNGGLAANNSIFPPLGSYILTERDGTQSAFKIVKFFYKNIGNYDVECAKIQWLDGTEEDKQSSFFVGTKIHELKTKETLC